MTGPSYGSNVSALPSGTVTFVFTDIEASTRRWEADASSMNAALVRHDAVLRDAVESHGGHVVKSTGDGMLAVFDRARSAVDAAGEAQRALAAGELPAARIAVHTGEAFERGGDYFGSALNRAARLMALGHGGQVLVSQATELLVTGFELRDMGEHRMRDLSRPERVFQLCDPALSVSFPPLRSLDNYPTNLPAQMTAFVGREDELRETVGAVAQCRVVTLTGVGGVGKTRLALHAAAEALSDFTDGVFFVEFGGVSDTSAIGESVAAALAVKQQSGETITDSLLSFLANKKMLLVLDNCEHLLEPIAELVSRVLPLAPDVSLLATSREPLRVDGEQVIAVPSLAVPDAAVGQAPELLVKSDSVRLFVERARATRSEFVLTDDNAAAVAQLCRRLDGIPLAIELAAARVRSMAPTEIAARLDQRFRLLTGGTRTSVNRHQTLRSAIDWSYELLETAERTALGRLAVCAGGFDLPAAEAIGADEAIDAFDVDDAVARLVDKSLVLATDLGEGTRYKMLETVREYAMERLQASNDLERVRTAHARYYTDFARVAGARLKGPDERLWLGLVEDELDNLRAAVAWSLASGETHLAVACVSALGLQGLRVERVVGSWAESIVASGEARDDEEYPAVLAFAAWARMAEGRMEEARQLFDAAVEQIDASSSTEAVVCRVLRSVAGMEPTTGQNPSAHARQWLRAAEVTGDLYEACLALNLLSVGQQMARDTTAIATAEESLRVARACGSPTAIAYCLFTLALVVAESDATRALALLDDARRRAEEAENTYALISMSGVHCYLLSQSGDHRAAADAFLGVAVDAARAGRREQQALQLSGFAASIAAHGSLELAAVVLGWAESVLGTIDVTVHLNLAEDARDALANLGFEIGSDRYVSLMADGAALSADGVLEYAQGRLSIDR